MRSISEFLAARDEYIARVKAELLGPGSEISIPALSVAHPTQLPQMCVTP